MKTIITVLAIFAICSLALSPISIKELDEPSEQFPHLGGAEVYRTQETNCPDPFSITYSNVVRKWPLENIKFNQYFSWGHPAVDLDAELNDPIYSVGYGFVSNVAYAPGGYGWYVTIKHPDGWETLYAHMNSEPYVEINDYVFPGKLLGPAGTTGHSTGPHLHFEILKDSCYLDPISVIGR